MIASEETSKRIEPVHFIAFPNDSGICGESGSTGEGLKPHAGAESQRAKVVWEHGNSLVSVGIQAVCGCAEFERVGRIPGSQEKVRGLILFEGEPIPLISLFGDTRESSSHKARPEEYAVVLSIKGVRFALKVEEIPRVVLEPRLEVRSRGKQNCLHGRHIQKLLQLCLSEDRKIEMNGEPPVRSNEKEHEHKHHNNKTYPTTRSLDDSSNISGKKASEIPDACCAS